MYGDYHPLLLDKIQYIPGNYLVDYFSKDFLLQETNWVQFDKLFCLKRNIEHLYICAMHMQFLSIRRYHEHSEQPLIKSSSLTLEFSETQGWE